VDAAIARIDSGLSTLAHETAELTGQDWERNHKQQAKERKMRLEAGLVEDPSKINTVEPPEDKQADKGDKENE